MVQRFHFKCPYPRFTQQNMVKLNHYTKLYSFFYSPFSINTLCGHRVRHPAHICMHLNFATLCVLNNDRKCESFFMVRVTSKGRAEPSKRHKNIKLDHFWGWNNPPSPRNITFSIVDADARTVFK